MIAATIPQLTLPELGRWNALLSAGATDYTFSTVEPGAPLPDFPFRGAFYAIGLSRQGSVELGANLANYRIQPDSLLVMGPEVIRRWQRQSADYRAEAVFFTEAFFLGGSADAGALRRFACWQPEAPHVVPLPAEAAAGIAQVLAAVRQVLAGPSTRKPALVCHYLHILLHLVADCYEQYAGPRHPTTTLPELVHRFQQLVGVHYLRQRQVRDYANLLCVSAKHLGETVKAATGQTAGAWIAAMLTLEAQVQLRHPTRSLAEIAQALHFGDASAFGKFFRRQTGLTPAGYRRRLRP